MRGSFRSLASWSEYVCSQTWIGNSFWLEAWNQHVLEYPILGSTYKDAVGVWPYMDHLSLTVIQKGFRELRDRGYVTFSGVFTPGELNYLDDLKSNFDIFRLFKYHFLCDPKRATSQLSKKTRYNISRGLRDCQVSKVKLADYIDDIFELHENLAEQTRFSRFARFDRKFLSCLSNLSGVECFAAKDKDQLLGFLLTIQCDNGTHFLATATSSIGKSRRASYALWAHAIDQLNKTPLYLGGSPGIDDSLVIESGVGRFKNRFSTHKAPAYFVGKVLRPDVYHEFSSIFPKERVFPPYRIIK